MNLIGELFRGLYPAQLFSCEVSYLSSLVNGLIVGNELEPVAMVALGFVSPFNAIVAALSGILSGGSRVLCGRFLGKGDTASIDKTFTLCVRSVAVLGLVLSVATYVLATPVAGLLGSQGESLAYTADYLRGLSVGIIFAMLLPCLMTFLQMGNDSGFALALAAVLAAANSGFALFFVKVLGMGVFGAGLATSVSQLLTVIIAVIRFRTREGLMHLTSGRDDAEARNSGENGRNSAENGTLSGIPQGNSILKQMIIIGIPSAIAALLYPARNIFINSIAMTIAGEDVVGALAILGSCGGFFDAFNVAMMTVVLMMASLAVGERDADFVRDIGRYCIRIGLIIGFAKVVFLALLGKPIALLFGAAGTRVAMTGKLLFTYSMSMPLNMIAVTLVSIYLAQGKIRDVNILNILTAFVYPVLFIVILKGCLGINAVWYCYAAAEVITLLTILAAYIIKNKSFPKPLWDVFMLDKIRPAGGSLKFRVHSLDEIAEISEKAVVFCKERGIDSKRAMFSGLCLEEMTRNIIETGFNRERRKSRKYTIEVFVMCEDDEVLMRIRDDGSGYNLEEIDRIFNPEDPLANIGVRIVSGLSKKMFYMTPFGMNVMQILL